MIAQPMRRRSRARANGSRLRDAAARTDVAPSLHEQARGGSSMERLLKVNLIPIVVLTVLLSVLTAVMVLVGFPWAGVGSAITCAVVTTGLTVALAFVFTHGPETHHA